MLVCCCVSYVVRMLQIDNLIVIGENIAMVNVKCCGWQVCDHTLVHDISVLATNKVFLVYEQLQVIQYGDNFDTSCTPVWEFTCNVKTMCTCCLVVPSSDIFSSFVLLHY